MGRLGEIQLSMFSTAPPLSDEPETLELLRPHKWAHGEATELPLVSIELAPHEGRWMWHSNLNSHCGSAQGARALPQWKKFADSKQEALLAGIKTFRSSCTAQRNQSSCGFWNGFGTRLRASRLSSIGGKTNSTGFGRMIDTHHSSL